MENMKMFLEEGGQGIIEGQVGLILKLQQIYFLKNKYDQKENVKVLQTKQMFNG